MDAAQSFAYRCPQCGVDLGRDGAAWRCAGCGRGMLAISALRARDRARANAWWVASSGAAPSGHACPLCGGALRTTPGTASPAEICRACQAAWLGADDLASVPEPPRPADAPVSAEARAALAVMQVATMREPEPGMLSSEPPDEAWRVVLACLGLPVRLDAVPWHRPPWATWAVVAACVTTAFAARGGAAAREWGFVAADPLRHAGATPLTAFLLHGDVLHLVGNAYALLLLGGDVELVLGVWRFLALIAAATVAGDAAHALLTNRPDVPCVGASGGISGVLAFCALRFPRLTLAFALWLPRIGLRPTWLRLPCVAAFAVWIALQLFGAWKQSIGASRVSAYAHLGGALAGGLAWLVWRRQDAAAAGRADRTEELGAQV